MPIKGEETSSYKVVCAYQRGGGGLCLSKGRRRLVRTRWFVPIKGEEGGCAYQRGGGD